MSNQNAEKVLVNAGLKKTRARIYVLDKISASQWALSHKELEDNAPQELDRVTIYRTLNTFEEQGIIHKILGEEGISHFAMCAHSCGHKHHEDNHVHFHCNKCKKIYCLEDFNVSNITAPPKFVIQKSDLKLEGTCGSCNNN